MNMHGDMTLPDENIVAYYWRAALSRWKLLAAIILGVTALGWAVSAFFLALSPTYEATARLNVVPTGEELGYASRFARGQNADGGLVMAQTYAEHLRSREVREAAVDRWIDQQAANAGMSVDGWLQVQAENAPRFSLGSIISYLNYGAVQKVPLRDQLVEYLGEYTEVEMIEGTFLMQVTVEWDSADGAAWFANALADEVITEVGDLSEESGESLAGVLRKELTAKQAQLAQLRQASRSRKINLGIVDVDAQKQALLQEEIAEQSRLTSDLAESRRASAQVAALEQQRTGLLGETQQSIDEQLALARPTAAAARQSISARQSRLGAIRGELGQLSRAELSIKTLDDQIALLEGEVGALLERLRFSETENLANRATIRLIDPALPPLVRSSPKILLNTLLAFVAGCALAGMLLLLLGPKGGRPGSVMTEPRSRLKETTTDDPADDPRRWPEPVGPPAGRPVYQSSQASPRRESSDIVAHPTLLRNPTPEGQPTAVHDTQDVVVALRPLEQKLPDIEPDPPVEPVAEVVAAPRAQPELIRHFPAPDAGRFYDTSEVAHHGAALADWLTRSLEPGQDIHVVSKERDAGTGLCLTKALLDACRAQGRPVRTIRAHPLRDNRQVERPAHDPSLRIIFHANGSSSLVGELSGSGGRVVIATQEGAPWLGGHLSPAEENLVRVAVFGHA